MWRRWGAFVLVMLLCGCATEPAGPEVNVAGSHNAAMSVASSSTPAASPLSEDTFSASPTPTVTILSSPTPPASPTPAVSPTPDPFAGLTIDDLSARSYGGDGIEIGEIILAEATFTRYAISYSSDGLRISGLMDVPVGDGPFPVIIVNHGYMRPVDYLPGMDTWRIADYLAEHGYIAIMPDFRNYAGSDTGPNPFRIGFAIDVMNLIAQLDSLPSAIPTQVGLLGHSMGGEVSMWPMVISDEVDAVVLYASMSGDVARNWEHTWRYWDRQTMDALALVYGTPEQSPEGYASMSPINYLDRVQVPVMIHHGTGDTAVPYWWSEELAGLLEAAGIDVTFYAYRGAGHTFHSEETFQTMMECTVAFFDEHVRGSD